MTSASVLGAAMGAGLALLVALSVVIYRYYAQANKDWLVLPPVGWKKSAAPLAPPTRRYRPNMATPPQQNFTICREQPQPKPYSSLENDSSTSSGATPHLHVRLSLPDVHLSDDSVCPSQSSYSLPTSASRRRSPIVGRTRSVDARGMMVPKLHLSDYRSVSPEMTGSDNGSSPLSSVSPLGALQPDLYKKKELVFFQNSPKTHEKPAQGRLHYRLKYDFDRSDLIVHLIEAMDLGSLSENGFNDPYIKIGIIPPVDARCRQTDIRRRTSDPFFNDVFKFPVSFDELGEKTLLLQVFDYDRYSRNDVTGEVRMALSEVDVTSEVEVWSEINRIFKVPQDRPEILLSLNYLPSAGRLTVVVLKAMNLVEPDAKELPDPHVKVCLVFGTRKTKKKKTSVKKANNTPVWNEAICFDIVEEDLRQCHLVVNVVDSGHHTFGPLLGTCVLGIKDDIKGFAHWQDMIDNPRKSIAMWHPIFV